ncbi:DUF2497 domain-containing protein [Altererythrobacter sp. MF3-039]|uniref:DUF2497 domain-containing protein n=1 Tax=Altererythrobacter sp. MF3-039 TaxID=3252901 RepID=UPI00390C52C8
MKQQGEASVEEILDSIKRVIARDNRDSADAERRRRSEVGVAEELASDEPDEIFDLSEAELVEDSCYDDDIGEEEDTPLITSSVSSSMQENFAALAMLSEPSAKPQIVRSGETSLEGLVREMLRPMLSEWLDKNLPGMVEKMVKDEIARIARKRS